MKNITVTEEFVVNDKDWESIVLGQTSLYDLDPKDVTKVVEITVEEG